MTDTAASDTGRLRATSGYVSLFVVILIPVVLMAAGLVLDGGRQLEARRQAQGAASAAARAAIQMGDEETFTNRLNPAMAADRGQASLAAEGANGSVSVNGQDVTVTVTAIVDFQILPGSRTVTETATATADQGVNSGTRPGR